MKALVSFWNNFRDMICFFGDRFPKLFVKFWSIKKKHGSGELGLLALCTCIWPRQNPSKSYSLKPLVRFLNNFTEVFFGWPFSKIVCEILIRKGISMAVGYLNYADMKKFLKILLWNGWSDFLTLFHTMTPFDAPRKQVFWKHCGKRRIAY